MIHWLQSKIRQQTESFYQVKLYVKKLLINLKSKPSQGYFLSRRILDEFFLYEYDGTWRIGKDFNKPDCWAFTNQTNISKMLTATWFESAKTKNKREITVQISPSIHRDDFGKLDHSVIRNNLYNFSLCYCRSIDLHERSKYIWCLYERK